MIVTTREHWRELRRPWNLFPCVVLLGGIVALVLTGNGAGMLTQALMLICFIHVLIVLPVQSIHRRGAPAQAMPEPPDRWARWLPVHIIAAEAMLIVGLVTIFALPDAWWVTIVLILVPLLYSLVAMPLSARGRPLSLEQGEVPNPVSSRV